MKYKVGDVLKHKIRNSGPQLIQLTEKLTWAANDVWIDTEGRHYNETFLDDCYMHATREEIVIAKLEGLI